MTWMNTISDEHNIPWWEDKRMQHSEREFSLPSVFSFLYFLDKNIIYFYEHIEKEKRKTKWTGRKEFLSFSFDFILFSFLLSM